MLPESSCHLVTLVDNFISWVQIVGFFESVFESQLDFHFRIGTVVLDPYFRPLEKRYNIRWFTQIKELFEVTQQPLKVHKNENFLLQLYYFFVSHAEIFCFCKKTFDWATIGEDMVIPLSLRLKRYCDEKSRVKS
jgi:hypothetical protein